MQSTTLLIDKFIKILRYKVSFVFYAPFLSLVLPIHLPLFEVIMCKSLMFGIHN
jgi:hypothetical protein